MIIASNFKTNHTRKSTREFVLQVEEFMSKTDSSVQARIYPTATALDNFEVDSSIKSWCTEFLPYM